MRLILSDFVLVCDDDFNIIKDGGICFNEQIIEVGTKKNLLEKYKNADIETLPKNSVIMPGLINSHTHLEFSANVADLSFGDFMSWLKSVIASRDYLQRKCGDELMEGSLNQMIKSGTTTIGATSSFGLDFECCVKTPMNILYFVEAIGSNPSAVDTLFDDFKARFYEAFDAKSSSFFPAISIHSPYSIHPILTKHVLNIAKKQDIIISTHFMESSYERDWLDEAKGGMGEFMKAFNPHSKPMCGAEEFLGFFNGLKSIFVHSVYAKENELQQISKQNGFIAHCPRSNRLLGSGAFNLELAIKNGICITIGTDGLSSNISLNLWDEMRAALFIHQDCDIVDLAALLLKSATTNGAKAFGLNKGELKSGFDADIITFCLKEIPEDISQLPLQTILQISAAENIYIRGVKL